MWLVKCEVRDGLIESERVVKISTAEGHKEEVTVSARQIKDNALEVGFIGREGDKALIELPRESARGFWRLWVPAEQVIR